MWMNDYNDNNIKVVVNSLRKYTNYLVTKFAIKEKEFETVMLLYLGVFYVSVTFTVAYTYYSTHTNNASYNRKLYFILIIKNSFCVSVFKRLFRSDFVGNVR